MQTRRIMMRAGAAVRPLSFDGESASEPLACSVASAWEGLPFEVHRLRSHEGQGESGPLDGESGLVVVTRGEYELTLRSRQGDVRRRSVRGSMQFMSGETRANVLHVEGDAELTVFHLSRDWLPFLPASPEVLCRRGPVAGGPTAAALVETIRGETQRSSGTGRLFAESVSLSLLSYAFGRLPLPDRARGASLSANERARVETYVHEHLDRDLGIAELAAVVGMPPRRFVERFRRAFETTPGRYVARARLQRGALMLRAGRHEIAEIALRVGYSSQSHFTAAFRQAFGETPMRYARSSRDASSLDLH